MCLGEGNAKSGGGEGGKRRGEVGGFESLGDIVVFFFFDDDDDMHSLARSPFLLFYFICMQMCKHREGCEQVVIHEWEVLAYISTYLYT